MQTIYCTPQNHMGKAFHLYELVSVDLDPLMMQKLPRNHQNYIGTVFHPYETVCAG
jgi:hypothetical protein